MITPNMCITKNYTPYDEIERYDQLYEMFKNMNISNKYNNDFMSFLDQEEFQVMIFDNISNIISYEKTQYDYCFDDDDISDLFETSNGKFNDYVSKKIREMKTLFSNDHNCDNA